MFSIGIACSNTRSVSKGVFINREILGDEISFGAHVGERIRHIRKSKGMTQKFFSASLGIVQGFLCTVECGKKIPSDTLLIALRYLYDINPEWLDSGKGEMYIEKPSPSILVHGRAAIPLLKMPPSSLESLSASLPKDFISISEIPADCFAFEYSGDFMSPTIRDGDIVIIRPGSQPVSGEIILIVGQWGDSFLRRYRKRGDEVFCSADNSSYSPFRPAIDTKILGIVHAVWRKIKI